jgi:hypothetical protein
MTVTGTTTDATGTGTTTDATATATGTATGTGITTDATAPLIAAHRIAGDIGPDMHSNNEWPMGMEKTGTADTNLIAEFVVSHRRTHGLVHLSTPWCGQLQRQESLASFDPSASRHRTGPL